MSAPDFRLCDWRALLPAAVERGGIDVLCVDAPYSGETHANVRVNASDDKQGYDRTMRRDIDYDAWNAGDVEAFVDAWAPLTRGWFLSLTDDVLAPVWKKRLRAHDRWCGTLIPCTERGATVRLSGGGPSSCTTFLVVARPRTAEFARWVTTESHYVVARERKPIVGGKALGLMMRILTDYSRRGDLVCDPCAGAATTLRAAVRLGRLALGAERMPEHHALGAKLLAGETEIFAPDRMSLRKQPSLFDTSKRTA